MVNGTGNMANTNKTHDPQYYEAQRILNELPTDRATQLFKTTRSGATTGLCATAFDAHRKVTLVAPTINISVDTFESSKKYTSRSDTDINTLNIPGNRACMMIEDLVEKFPDLHHLSMIPLPMKCDDCSHVSECRVTEFLRSTDPDGVGLTHQKLNALMHSDSDTAKAVVEKLLTMSNLVIIDEAHKLETNNAATVQVYPHPDMSKYDAIKENYPVLNDFITIFNAVRKNNDETVIQQFVGNSDRSNDIHMAINVVNDPGNDEGYTPPDFQFVMSAVKDVVEIMKRRNEWELSVQDVVYLSDIVMTLSGNRLVMHYIKSEAGSVDVDIVHLSSPGGLRNAMREYVIQLNMLGNCKIVFTTGTFGDFYYGNMFGMDVTPMMMADTRKTNEIMTIHPDTYRISTYDYWREEGHAYKPRIINAIKKYCDLYDDIRFMCMKRSVARAIHKWMLVEGYDIDVDYYGSANTIGTDYDKRVMVCIGAPVCSINAHDGISSSYEESQKTRTNGNHAAFWQAISRAKDPNGEEESHIYCIGIREDEIRMMCTWGVNRRLTMDGVRCLSVSVEQGKDKSVGMPNIEPMQTFAFLHMLKNTKNADRSYMMRHMHIKAAELDSLLSDSVIAKHVDIGKTNGGRKSKKIYNYVE